MSKFAKEILEDEQSTKDIINYLESDKMDKDVELSVGEKDSRSATKQFTISDAGRYARELAVRKKKQKNNR